MKKAIALTLAAVFFLTALVLLVQVSSAKQSAAECYSDWRGCRQNAFEADEGWLRTTVMLTVCDLGWGKCTLGL